MMVTSETTSLGAAATWQSRALRLCALLAASAVACSSPTSPTPGPPSSAIPDVVNCAAFPDARTSAYVLPVAVGQRVRVTNTFGHYTPANQGVGLHAMDFDLPIGAPVHAVRSGVVLAVEERFSDDDRMTYHENWVMVRHADGTVARYIHLTKDGALVEPGEAIDQGQVIGKSGSSGPLTAPHLHFDVQACGPNLPPDFNSLPCGMTVPVSFRNTEDHACGLEARATYTALPFTPDAR